MSLDDRDLEVSLQKLVPQSRLNTDRLIYASGFEAGLASRQRRLEKQSSLKWLGAAAFVASAATISWILLLLEVVWEAPHTTIVQKSSANPDPRENCSVITTRPATELAKNQNLDSRRYSLLSMGRRMRESDDFESVEDDEFDRNNRGPTMNIPTNPPNAPTILNLQQAILHGRNI